MTSAHGRGNGNTVRQVRARRGQRAVLEPIPAQRRVMAVSCFFFAVGHSHAALSAHSPHPARDVGRNSEPIIA
jgi:hypothetical protein